MKRLCYGIIAMLIALSLFPACALGDQTFEQFTYVINDGRAVITSYTGNETDLTIPDKVNGYPVTVIGEAAFKDNVTLITVAFPEDLEKIDDYAFEECTSLVSVKFCNNLKEIRNSAFSGCSSLAYVKFPYFLSILGEFAFKNCASLETVDLPENVTSIGSDVFIGCMSLRSVKIPIALFRAGDIAFYGCSAICEIEYYGDSLDYVWTSDILSIRLDIPLSAFIPAQPVKNMCLLVLDSCSEIVYDHERYSVSLASNEQLVDQMDAIPNSITRLSNNQLAFTVNPNQASILLLVKVEYVYFDFSGWKIKPMGWNAYNCEVTLTASDLQTHDVIAVVTEGNYWGGDQGYNIYGKSEISNDESWMSFPYLGTDKVQSFVNAILSYTGSVKTD